MFTGPLPVADFGIKNSQANASFPRKTSSSRRVRKKAEVKACESLRNEAYLTVPRSDEG